MFKKKKKIKYTVETTKNTKTPLNLKNNKICKTWTKKIHMYILYIYICKIANAYKSGLYLYV